MCFNSEKLLLIILMKKFKITRANFWRMIGFYACSVCTVFLLIAFIWMFGMPSSTADFWAVRYIQFVTLIAAVCYAFLTKKNLERAHLLDAAQAALAAYERSKYDVWVTQEEEHRFWEEYLRLNALANQ